MRYSIASPYCMGHPIKINLLVALTSLSTVTDCQKVSVITYFRQQESYGYMSYTVTMVMTIKLTGMKLDDTQAGHEEHNRLLLVHRQTVHVGTLHTCTHQTVHTHQIHYKYSIKIYCVIMAQQELCRRITGLN